MRLLVWAVGEASRTGGHEWPITLHWDGRRWKVVRLTAEESLRGVAADGHGGLWASGGAYVPLHQGAAGPGSSSPTGACWRST